MDWKLELVLPVVGALVAGAVIGFEREYRSRPAGFRTHILVCLASALLMLAAVHQVRWLTDTPLEVIRIDPARMAHGVLTGIGFLCGGVIFREGFTVHGLTTAASLWITSALGTLYGIGFFELAIGGTVITVAVLALLRLADDHMPQMYVADLTVRFKRAEAMTQAQLLALLEELELRATSLTHRMVEEGAGIEMATTIRSLGRIRGDRLAERLGALPAVSAFEIAPRND